MCVAPIYITTKDGRQPVQCGKCYECLVRRRTDWTNRIALEAEYNPPAVFLTLTYAPEFCDGNLHYKSHIVSFIRNVRRLVDKFTYCVCGEYGGNTQRPHYHFIIFGLDIGTVDDICLKYWPYGHWDIGNLLFGGAKYVAKYHILAKMGALPHFMLPEDPDFYLKSKRDYFDDKYDLYCDFSDVPLSPDLAPEFFNTSKGIGKSFLADKQEVEKLQNRVSDKMTVMGQLVSIPRYIRNKIYDDDMKEQYKEIMQQRAFDHFLNVCNEMHMDDDDYFDYDGQYQTFRRQSDILKRQKYWHKRKSHDKF